MICITRSRPKATRDTALAYFRQTLSTRLDNKKTGAIVVVMQRLHERDLAACCQDLGFTQVCLPAEAETRTAIVFPRSVRLQIREPGDLLWPARDGRAELDTQQRILGSAAYAGQYGTLIPERAWVTTFCVSSPCFPTARMTMMSTLSHRSLCG